MLHQLCWGWSQDLKFYLLAFGALSIFVLQIGAMQGGLISSDAVVSIPVFFALGVLFTIFQADSGWETFNASTSTWPNSSGRWSWACRIVSYFFGGESCGLTGFLHPYLKASIEWFTVYGLLLDHIIFSQWHLSETTAAKRACLFRASFQ